MRLSHVLLALTLVVGPATFLFAEPTGQQADGGAELSKVEGISLRRSTPLAMFDPRRIARESSSSVWTDISPKFLLQMNARDEHGEIPMFGVSRLPSSTYTIKFEGEEEPDFEGHKKRFLQLLDTLEQAFDLSIKWEEREVAALSLQKGDNWEQAGLKAIPRDQLTGYDLTRPIGFGVTATLESVFNGDMNGFAKYVQEYVEQPVLNETKLTGVYDLKWRHSPKTPLADISKYCADHGLALVPTKCKIKAVFIDKAGPKKN